jgi:hypothetical protein
VRGVEIEGSKVGIESSEIEGHYLDGIGRKAGVSMQQNRNYINGNKQGNVHQS